MMKRKWTKLLCTVKRRFLAIIPLIAIASLAIAQSKPIPSKVDPDIYAESHKSRYQRRQEANERMMNTVQGQQQAEAAKAQSKDANTAQAAANKLSAPTPTGINPLVDITIPNWANSPNIRKFVDSLPGLGSTHANNLGQYVSVAEPDTVTYPGSDYYEIALIRFFKRMHSDLPETDLRCYIQIETPVNAATSKHVQLFYPDGKTPILDAAGNQVYGYDSPQYLGASIVAKKDRPVRIKFTNYLPNGTAGDLPLPVDTTVMGAGMGPLGMNVTTGFPMNYTQNRADLHLHGGITPWISDGTPHQWITPAGEKTDYPKGAVVTNVSDMPDPGPGSSTYYYTNGQSARLLFYHDHTYGITRLNVYAGEAAGYLITDPVEQDLINGTNLTGGNPAKVALPTMGGAYPLGIPLVIQDKTFVNDATTPPGPGFTGTPTAKTNVVDPLWYTHLPGTRGGNFWIGHEYLPNENIYDDIKGYNEMGRWDYGPWMNPPMVVMDNTLPSPTIIPEAFMDTMVVNGTAFPYIEAPATLVRFRILNACNDRMLNLQLYKADPLGFKVADTSGTLWGTEVKMVTAAPNANHPATWPVDGRNGDVPDPATSGPDFWQIGNESGLLAQVNVVKAQPVNYDYSRRSVTFGGVTDKALLLPPAVRADVLVDLSKYNVGDTLILYNDAPAPMPLYDTRYDYSTGYPDQTAIGGAPTIAPGFGPNTRTVMQIRITTTGLATPANYLPDLQTSLPKAFAASQEAPIVPESVFNAAYGTNYRDTFMNVVDESLNVSGAPQTIARVVTVAPGLNYTAPPIVRFYGGGGAGAAATATLNGVNNITLLTAGSGYTTPPAITITAAPGDAGAGAQAVATVSGGTVTAISITAMGSNYLVAPTVTIAAPPAGGVAATAQANITLGSVGDIILTNPGSGYTKAPYVYLTGGGGTGATADALLVGAMVPTIKNLVEGMDMEFGRMNAQLGSTPSGLTPQIGAGPVIGMAKYIDPPTEFLDDNTPVLWRIAHIGVDSHSIHFHLFDVQVINRVDWTNTLKPPYPEEIGWKDTIRTNPFEDIILALRPKAGNMKMPFGVPNSVRLLDVTMPAGSTMSFTPVAPPPGLPAVAQITNVLTNFGWEYVWHCHLLGHEENDMMRPTILNIPTALPTQSTLATPALAARGVNLTWSDPTPWDGSGPASTQNNPSNEIGYQIQRSPIFGAYTTIGTAPANSTSYVDTSAVMGSTYNYRVVAYNASGNTNSNSVRYTVTIPAPTNLTATPTFGTASVFVTCNWTNNTTANTGLTIQRATNNTFTAGLVTYDITPGTLNSYQDTSGMIMGTVYYYRVRATIGASVSAWSNTATVQVVIPGPSALTATPILGPPATVTLNWVNNAPVYTDFTIQRATNAGFTTGLATLPVATGVATSFVDTTMLPGITYYYRIRANIGASATPWSNTISTIIVIPAPTNLTATLSPATPLSVTLNWTTNTALNTGYTIQRATNAAFTAGLATYTVTPGNATSYVNATGLVANTVYYYRIAASIGAGLSAWSNTVTAQFATPAAPSSLAGVRSGASIRLTWRDNSTNETGFTIQRSTSFLFTTVTTFNITGANITTYTDTTAATGRLYFYRIRANNVYGSSGWSNTIIMF